MKDILNILFIEEDTEDVENILNQIGKEQIHFRKMLVDSRDDFVEAIGSFSPDLIISAYSLSKINGMEALNIRNEHVPSIPFILVTAPVNEMVAVECIKAGADDYIIKTNLSRLGPAIKSAIRKRELLSQRDIAEKRLKESEEKYRSIVDHSPDAVLLHSWGRIIFANPTTLKLLCADSLDQIRETSLLNFVHPDYRERAKERIKKIYETGKPQGYTQEKYINLKGESFDVEVMGIPVNYLGEPAVQTIARDIRKRKQVEEELIKAKEKAEESDHLKTAFLHNISHEIRTPMNAIVGFSALLNEPGLTPDNQSLYLKIITESSDQLLAIVNDIIEISNIEVGILKANINQVNLNSQLLALYQQFNPRAIEKGIEFRLHTALSGFAAEIKTDSLKLIQILSNLLSNAFKFTQKGKISFGYRLSGNYLEFFVSDTGIGIREDQFGKIFERFYQIESSASRAYEGTGLGLAITRAYVEFLGGNIWVRSDFGRGSSFYFTLPYVSSVKQHISEMESTDKNRENEMKKAVLIAEDDDNNFYLMKELLSDLNIKILRATNGVEAVEAVKSGQRIDLILMDVKMPLMDGYEATRQIKEERPDVKILAQTAYADDEIKAMESGASGFISKPFVKDRFVNLVREYL